MKHLSYYILIALLVFIVGIELFRAAQEATRTELANFNARRYSSIEARMDDIESAWFQYRMIFNAKLKGEQTLLDSIYNIWGRLNQQERSAYHKKRKKRKR